MIGEYSLTSLDQRVLNRIQWNFPLTEDPYGQLAGELGLTREQLHQTVCTLKGEGIIRRIGASYNANRLGYATTLVAAEVEDCAIEQVAAFINRFPEVTHNYRRDHWLNLWFTVIASTQERLKDIMAVVGACAGVRRIQALPSCGTFKLKVDFRFGESRAELADQHPGFDHRVAGACGMPSLPELHKPLIACTCGDIGESLDPYGNLAGIVGLSRSDLLGILTAYRTSGLLRRFGAILRHQAAGFSGNGMSVWRVPENRIREIGRYMSSQSYVSHCYQRRPAEGWPYNLYAMAHGLDRPAVTARCRECACEIGIEEYKVLFSLQEYKKTSMVYFPEYAEAITRQA